MEEHHEDADGTNESHGKEVGSIKGSVESTIIGILAMNNMLWNEPSHEQTGKEGAQWKHILCCQFIAELKNTKPHHAKTRTGSHRQGTEDGDDAAHECEHPGCPFAGCVQFLMEECRTYLVHGDGRGEGGEHKKRIEHDRDDIADDRHRRKGLLEHIGQGNENERWTSIGRHANRESGRENHQSRKDGYHGVEQRYLNRRTAEMGLTAEIRGIGTEAGRT